MVVWLFCVKIKYSHQSHALSQVIGMRSYRVVPNTCAMGSSRGLLVEYYTQTMSLICLGFQDSEFSAYLEPFCSKKGVHFHAVSSSREGVSCSDSSEGCTVIDLGEWSPIVPVYICAT